MTKDSFNRKKNYSNTKIIELDPLGKRLSDAGFTGGASKRMLKKSLFKTEAKKAFKETKDLKKSRSILIVLIGFLFLVFVVILVLYGGYY